MLVAGVKFEQRVADRTAAAESRAQELAVSNTELERVAHELRAFGAAVERRFGDGGIHQMLRAGGRTNAVTAPSVAPADQRCWTRLPG